MGEGLDEARVELIVALTAAPHVQERVELGSVIAAWLEVDLARENIDDERHQSTS